MTENSMRLALHGYDLPRRALSRPASTSNSLVPTTCSSLCQSGRMRFLDRRQRLIPWSSPHLPRSIKAGKCQEVSHGAQSPSPSLGQRREHILSRRYRQGPDVCGVGSRQSRRCLPEWHRERSYLNHNLIRRQAVQRGSVVCGYCGDESTVMSSDSQSHGW